jgi:hypothetical protein
MLAGLITAKGERGGGVWKGDNVAEGKDMPHAHARQTPLTFERI